VEVNNVTKEAQNLQQYNIKHKGVLCTQLSDPFGTACGPPEIWGPPIESSGLEYDLLTVFGNTVWGKGEL
jgi:hypothetical protein